MTYTTCGGHQTTSSKRPRQRSVPSRLSWKQPGRTCKRWKTRKRRTKTISNCIQLCLHYIPRDAPNVGRPQGLAQAPRGRSGRPSLLVGKIKVILCLLCKFIQYFYLFFWGLFSSKSMLFTEQFSRVYLMMLLLVNSLQMLSTISSQQVSI